MSAECLETIFVIEPSVNGVSQLSNDDGKGVRHELTTIHPRSPGR
jgi:hypothetical protein